MKKIGLWIFVILVVSTYCSCVTAENKPDMFGIYVASIDGNNFKKILSDPYREMNHVRVSPDGELITFTRFNKKNIFSQLAEEEDGYLNTQIMIATIDGQKVTALTPEGKYNINANSYWTPDSKGLVYMSNDNPDKRTLTLKRIDLKLRKSETISPSSLSWVSDPHQLGNKITFPAADDINGIRAIWEYNLESKKLKRITTPVLYNKGKMVEEPPPGDSDPKWSPDGKMIALTRHHGDSTFENIVVDLTTGKELSISPRGAIDVMPEWSSDGKLLVFWHVNMKNFSEIGLYTIKPNGKNRTMIPLPPGYHFKMPAFFPNDGSSPNARIIFTGKYVPVIGNPTIISINVK